MIIPFVDLKSQYLSIKKEIDFAINHVINSSSFIGGEFVSRFENEFRQLMGFNNVVSCANGTDAMEILLESFGVSKGDEVIVPSISWISTSECVSRVGAKPIFVDVDDNFLINLKNIEEKISNKTKMIIPVHLYGRAVDMFKLIKIAKKYNLLVLEDCAQSHLAEFKNKKIGSFGDCASFSFYPGKNLGAYGDAGCMSIKDKKIARKARMIANHGQITKNNHFFEGRNSRMDGIQAAILSVKLQYLDEWTDKRIKVASVYYNYLKDCKDVILPKIDSDRSSVYHLFVIRTPKRDLLKTYLKDKGIDTAIHYPTPLPLLQPYSENKYHTTDFPNASIICKEILSLPIYPELKHEQIKYISECIIKFNE